jgi:hypothetical protein
MAKLTSWEQLLLWTAGSAIRQDIAEEAMVFVNYHHLDVERESEQYYSLVLARALGPGK